MTNIIKTIFALIGILLGGLTMLLVTVGALYYASILIIKPETVDTTFLIRFAGVVVAWFMIAFDYKVNAIVERIDKTNEILSEMTVESPFDESTVNSSSSDSTKAQ